MEIQEVTIKMAKRAIVVLLMAVIFIAGALVADVLNVNFIGKKRYSRNNRRIQS